MFKRIFFGFVLACQATLVHAEVHKVSQKGKAFSTQALTIKPDDTIMFLNDDTISHNVFSSSEGTRFNLKIQLPGTRNGQKFGKSGAGEIRCAIHPGMKMKLIIKE
ncbi:MAG TPA: plastocyanin/azurin family copper-binding protein [Oligoflexus sp.]|uniref:plastocyanin/azurin family copper-binding protein n=1 Tax=Oligoflexus sp. TaxID=1971216 RepID=UPI002D381EDE|nr:plastocyanin/azurin family copper-binding protein [Oligoflexus sp.]HYX36773.1 plastocyanin/azurin family copper-binding protein [Oligoflexus sp.]